MTTKQNGRVTANFDDDYNGEVCGNDDLITDKCTGKSHNAGGGYFPGLGYRASFPQSAGNYYGMIHKSIPGDTKEERKKWLEDNGFL